MKRRLIGIAFGLVIVAIAGWWLANRPFTASVKVVPRAENTGQAIQSQVATPTPAVASVATPPPKTKEQEMSEVLAVLNHRPIEFYGKLVDQGGNPVGGAKVIADVMVAKAWMTGKGEFHYTETDENGFFTYKGIEGRDIAFGFEKPGYEYRTNRSKSALFKYSLLTPTGERHHPDPNAPVVFTIWKLKGPESLVHFDYARAALPVNGMAISFDLLAGKKLPSGGDIVLKLERQPEHIERGKRFDWKVVIEVPGGGIAELNDAYPNEAPADGYEAQFTIEMPATSKEWQSSVTRHFYVKARGGELYARLTLRITADYEPPPTGVTMEAFVNPSGSRNLEYDPSKQVPTR